MLDNPNFFNAEAQIGRSIKKIRELKEISQADVAAKLHISEPAYSKIESGKTKLDTKRLQEIAKILEVEVAHIYDFNPNQFIFNQSNNKNGSQ